MCEQSEQSKDNSTANDFAELKAFLVKNYSNRIQIESEVSKVDVTYILVFKQYDSFEELQPFTDFLDKVAQKFPQLRFALATRVSQNNGIYAVNHHKLIKCHNSHNLNCVIEFCEQFLEDIQFCSQSLPNGKTVSNRVAKIAVSSNYHELVTRNTKDVYIVYHRANCYGRNKIPEILDKVASILYCTGDYKYIDVVHMELDDNYLPDTRVSKYVSPQYFFQRHDAREKFISQPWYKGFTPDTILKFIASNATRELKYYDRSGQPKSHRRKRDEKVKRYETENYVQRFHYSTYIEEKYGIKKPESNANSKPPHSYKRQTPAAYKDSNRRRKEEYEDVHNLSHLYDEKYRFDNNFE